MMVFHSPLRQTEQLQSRLLTDFEFVSNLPNHSTRRKKMDNIDHLVKGIPNQLLNMFRGFCTMAGKTESEGIIDLMIEYIEKNSAGDKSNFKKVVDEYRAAQNKKKK
jgi:hypothetical protein